MTNKESTFRKEDEYEMENILATLEHDEIARELGQDEIDRLRLRFIDLKHRFCMNRDFF